MNMLKLQCCGSGHHILRFHYHKTITVCEIYNYHGLHMVLIVELQKHKSASSLFSCWSLGSGGFLLGSSLLLLKVLGENFLIGLSVLLACLPSLLLVSLQDSLSSQSGGSDEKKGCLEEKQATKMDDQQRERSGL